MASSSTDSLRQLVYGFAVTKVVNLPHAFVAAVTDLHMEHDQATDGPLPPALDDVLYCCCAFDRRIASGLTERTATSRLRSCVLGAMQADPGWLEWWHDAAVQGGAL